MKRLTRLIIIVIIISQAGLLYAQEEKEPEYLLKKGKVKVSGFGGPLVGFTTVGNDFAVYSGGGGAVLLNQTVFFGGYGEGVATQHDRPDFTANGFSYTEMKTYFGHGGFWIGYIHNWQKAVHLGFSTKLGWGSISLSDLDYSEPEESLVDDIVFVATPQIELEMNMLKWFKINLGAGYQFVSGVNESYVNADGNEIKYFNANDFSRPKFTIGLLFGGFTK